VAQLRTSAPPAAAAAASFPQHKSRALHAAFANFLPAPKPPAGFAIGVVRRNPASSRPANSSSSSASSSSSLMSAPNQRPFFLASLNSDVLGCPGLGATTWEGRGSITFGGGR
jgi:hypothetical protein